MGAESVEYHSQSIIERGDDYQGQSLAYYGSRGETPLLWGGSGAQRSGLSGAVSPLAYEAIYGPGGARHPGTGERLVVTLRPGMELVIAAHKSVAELGVIGRADHMHAIMDAERDATLNYLDEVTRSGGGRRGRAATPTATGGLIYSHTRHATSRAGDPSPHDHVLLANVVEMRDGQGGWKAAQPSLWRDHLHAATMVGRMASARVAVDLGYGIEADDGPSGRLGHWKVAGVPDEVMEIHSKRAAAIQEEMDRRGETSYQARGIAARYTRDRKGHDSPDELEPRWVAELESLGWAPPWLTANIERAAREFQLQRVDAGRLLAEVLSDEAGRLAVEKIWARRDLIVEIAPHLFGQDPVVLDQVVSRGLADPEVVPLVAVAGAREQVYALASVLGMESAIAGGCERLVERSDAATAGCRNLDSYGHLSPAQREAAEQILTSGRGAEIVIGVAGSGKTTMLTEVARGFEAAGCQVIGTATSGQAARNLGDAADIDESRTLASLTWRLDHDRLTLDRQTVVILDEAGMTDDPDMLRLVGRIEAAGAKLVMVGDDRQLGPVGPGGALGALVGRHPEMLHELPENFRQMDPAERLALEQLRSGNVGVAADWYFEHGRVNAQPDREQSLDKAVQGWAADIVAEQDAHMYAWRRRNVAALNQRAREWMVDQGRVIGPEVRGFAIGDQLVTTAPVPGQLVTSERAEVIAVNANWDLVDVRTTDNRIVRLTGDQIDVLDYGYATTVHRSQGATVDTSHVLADGGGRELAYVAMSRARGLSHVYCVADDTAVAVEDLQRDWQRERRPAWAIDAGQPATAQAIAITAAEMAGSPDPRRDALIRQLDLYRDRLDTIDPPRIQQSAGIEM